MREPAQSKCTTRHVTRATLLGNYRMLISGAPQWPPWSGKSQLNVSPYARDHENSAATAVPRDWRNLDPPAFITNFAVFATLTPGCKQGLAAKLLPFCLGHAHQQMDVFRAPTIQMSTATRNSARFWLLQSHSTSLTLRLAMIT